MPCRGSKEVDLVIVYKNEALHIVRNVLTQPHGFSNIIASSGPSSGLPRAARGSSHSAQRRSTSRRRIPDPRGRVGRRRRRARVACSPRSVHPSANALEPRLFGLPSSASAPGSGIDRGCRPAGTRSIKYLRTAAADRSPCSLGHRRSSAARPRRRGPAPPSPSAGPGDDFRAALQLPERRTAAERQQLDGPASRQQQPDRP